MRYRRQHTLAWLVAPDAPANTAFGAANQTHPHMPDMTGIRQRIFAEFASSKRIKVCTAFSAEIHQPVVFIRIYFIKFSCTFGSQFKLRSPQQSLFFTQPVLCVANFETNLYLLAWMFNEPDSIGVPFSQYLEQNSVSHLIPNHKLCALLRRQNLQHHLGCHQLLDKPPAEYVP